MELILFLAIFILPFAVSWDICQKRNRNPWKGVFVTFCFGWVATAGLWLALKTRREDGVFV